MRLDVVIPAHNEEARIDRTLRAYRSMLIGPEVRFRVALDDCSDATAAVVGRHAAQDERILTHQYPRLGKGGVVMETFRRCEGDVVGFVDADCSTPPGEFLRLVEVVDGDGMDVAIASRGHPGAVVPRTRPAARRITSGAFRLLVRRLFRLPFHDTQCGAKVARRAVIDSVLPVLSSRDFLFDVDLLVTAQRMGFQVAEVPTIWIDQPGSKVRPLSDAMRMAVSSLNLWMHHHLLAYPRPARPGAAVPAGGTIPAPESAPEPVGVSLVVDLREASVDRGTA